MSKKIIGVTVGTPISLNRIAAKIKPVKTVNNTAPDENGNVNVNVSSGITKESDPTVPSWAKQPQKPTYTAEEVGAVSTEALPEAVNSALAQAKASGEFDGEDGKSAYEYAKDGGYTGTEAEFAEDSNPDNIKAELGQIEAPKIVSSVDEMTDTSKHYVNQSTGTIWAYMKHEKHVAGSTVPNFTNVFDADKAMIGYRWSGSGKAPTSFPQGILSDFITCNLSSGEHIIRIKNGRLHGNGSNAGVAYFTTNENSSAFAYSNNLAMTPTEEADGVLAYKLGEANGSMISGYANTRYIRCVAVQYNNENLVSPQTLENAKQIIITIDEPITYTETEESTEVYYEWTDTGISYAPTFKTDLVGVLGEDNVIYLSDNLPSGTYTLKYLDDNYDTVGTISK